MKRCNARQWLLAGLILVLVTASVFAQGQVTGSLVASDGIDIPGWRLRQLIDEYIPTNNAHSTLIVLTECFGGDLVDTLANGRADTAVISATSPGEVAYYSYYDYDAATALAPEPGRTSDYVHQEGIASKHSQENPTQAGSPVSLEPTSATGPIKSRHILIFAGDPDGGTKGDAAQRDKIKDNFKNESNTTVTSVGGSGTGGWDYPGTQQGLKDALKAIRGNMGRDEQFILFVTDHGDNDTYAVCLQIDPNLYRCGPLEMNWSVYYRLMELLERHPSVTIFVEQEVQPPSVDIAVGDQSFSDVPFTYRVDLDDDGQQDPGDGWEARVEVDFDLLDPNNGDVVEVWNLPGGVTVWATLSSGPVPKYPPDERIPAISERGVMVMVLLTAAIGAIVLIRRRQEATT